MPIVICLQLSTVVAEIKVMVSTRTACIIRMRSHARVLVVTVFIIESYRYLTVIHSAHPLTTSRSKLVENEGVGGGKLHGTAARTIIAATVANPSVPAVASIGNHTASRVSIARIFIVPIQLT